VRSVTIDLDGPLHYADFGGEGPAIVLVHGLGGSHSNWLAVAPQLAERARVLAPDLAGFGLTAPAGRSASVTANRALLDRFIAEVIGGPAILVGNSMGGLISIMQAAQRPDATAGLVLVDPALPRASGGFPDAEIVAAFAAYALPGLGERFVARRARTLGPEGVVRDTMRRCTVDPSRVPPDVVDAMIEVARKRMEFDWAVPAFLEAARSLLRVLALRARFDAMIQAITAPTLIVHGASDRLVPLVSARRIATMRPDWTFEVFEDIGHVPQLEAPDRFVEVVSTWLDGAGRAAAFGAAAEA
jgi:pimeloyl-ACP methyl ester carboxylesterase